MGGILRRVCAFNDIHLANLSSLEEISRDSTIRADARCSHEDWFQ
jgi:hypothetical protein